MTWAFGHDNSYKAEVEREAKEMKWLPLATITALIAGVLLMAAPVEGKATRIPFTAEESCTITSPGTWTSADGTLHIRGLTEECDNASSIPWSGTDYAVLNANLDATGSGPMWGTWRLEVEGGGWEGVWHGTVTGMLSTEPSGMGRSVGHGTGIYEGQQMFCENVFVAGENTHTCYLLVP